MAMGETAAGQTHRSASDKRAEFLDIASHELRGPLTALRGQVQLMQRKLRNQPERTDDLVDLDKMLYQIERLTSQVDVFLAATHIAQRRFQIMRAPCDIVGAMRRVTGLFAVSVRDHDVRFESDTETITGDWDRKRIEELTTILLTNAVKYSRDGEIVVSVTCEQDGVRVEVSDRGPGVPPADRRRIFLPYETGSTTENRGVGLGLSVADEIVRRHGGRLGVRARRGGGSIFWFELPIAAAEKPQPAAKAGRGAAKTLAEQPTRTTRRKRTVAATA